MHEISSHIYLNIQHFYPCSEGRGLFNI